MHRLPILALSFFSLFGGAHAEYLSAVRPLPGTDCMQLTLSREQISNPSLSIPVRDIPSATGRVLAEAATILVAPAPQQPTAGFLQVFLSDGRRGWVAATVLKPWRSSSSPNRRCIPSVMSNGLIGFEVK